MALEPGGIIAWVLVGLIAGWLTGKVMKGAGYGVFRDIVLGIVGAFIGGIVMSLYERGGEPGARISHGSRSRAAPTIVMGPRSSAPSRR